MIKKTNTGLCVDTHGMAHMNACFPKGDWGSAAVISTNIANSTSYDPKKSSSDTWHCRVKDIDELIEFLEVVKAQILVNMKIGENNG